jgi:LuxR family transcriptional regulator, transcriptional regulator of spore coat protein
VSERPSAADGLGPIDIGESSTPNKSNINTDELSPRELDVLRLVATGLSAKEVALELGIAPRTVEHHLDHARVKTNTRNRTHMVAHALQSGLISVD